MSMVYQYDASGYFAGESDDYGGPLPNNSTRTAPKLQEGHIPRWTGKKWEQVEDHRGRQGYVDGKPYTVKEPGPLPEGWSDDPPPPTQQELDKRRIAEIHARLDELDRQSVRPLRAIIKGTGTDVDTQTLAAKEAEAQKLREELMGLTLAQRPEPAAKR